MNYKPNNYKGFQIWPLGYTTRWRCHKNVHTEFHHFPIQSYKYKYTIRKAVFSSSPNTHSVTPTPAECRWENIRGKIWISMSGRVKPHNINEHYLSIYPSHCKDRIYLNLHFSQWMVFVQIFWHLITRVNTKPSNII